MTADLIPPPPWRTPRKVTPPRQSLSQDAIVTAALAILDSEGMDAVSMRRVAQRLGTGAASLYAHVANKDELLQLMLDAVIGEVPIPEPDPRRWAEQLKELWRGGHRAFAAHGEIAQVMLGNIPVGPNALRLSEAMLAVMRAGGLPDQVVAWSVDVVGLYIAADAVEGALRARAGEDNAAYFEQIGEYFASLPPSVFPNTVALLPQLMSGDGEQRFEFGLDLLIRGLETHAPSAKAARAIPGHARSGP